MEKKRPILSISMLASDRMDTLPRCLESLTAIREAIPCELIITVTTDNPEVYTLAQKYADKLTTFEWCKDFAKARNVGLKLAEGEWFMFIDDDEWFAEPEELIEFFRSGEYKDYGYAHHRIKNFHDSELKTYTYRWVTRLTKIWSNTAFHSKVHEYMAPYQGASKQIPAVSYHSGYVFLSNEEREMHFERNFRLLEKMEKEEPDELRWKVQMLQEYVTIQDWESMVTYGKKSLEYLWGKARKVDLQHFAIIHIAYAYALNESKRYDMVDEVYHKAQAVVKDTIVAKAYMELCMAKSCWAQKKYESAKLHIKNYLDEYKIYCEKPSLCATELLGIFLADTFTDNKIAHAYSILLSSELKLGNEKALYLLYPKLMWEKEIIQSYCQIEVDILEYLMQVEDYTMMEKVLQDALSAIFIRPKMMKAILDYKRKDKDRFFEILKVVKTLDIQGWYKEYANLLTMEEPAAKKEVLESAARFINLVPSIFSIPTEIANVLEEHDIRLADLYLFVDFMVWKDALNERLEELQMNQVEELKNVLENSALKEDIRYYYFMMIFMEQKLLIAEQNHLTFDEMTDLLAAFSDYTCLCYEEMFDAQLQEMEVENWPKKYQAAKWLQIYFTEVGENITAALGCLAKVIGAYPRLAGAMQYYLEKIQSEILNG